MMINNLEEITLGREAIDYITESLRDGKELSSMLLATLRLESGSVSTYLPKKIATPSVNKFRTGGILSAEVSPIAESPTATPNLDHFLVSLVKSHLQSTSSALCLFENRLADPNDAWLAASGLHNLATRTTVCHYLTSQDSRDIELITLTLKKSRSIRPPLLAILTSHPEGTLASHIGDADRNLLKAIVERTVKLIVGAYDGEGFILWQSAQFSPGNSARS